MKAKTLIQLINVHEYEIFTSKDFFHKFMYFCCLLIFSFQN